MARVAARLTRALTVLALALAMCLLATPVTAGNQGEARSLLRDPDRPYAVVAGDADASAVVQNPANLAYLQALNAVVDFAVHSGASGRRGSGAGLFVALPLPWHILSLGAGIQGMWRQLPGSEADDPQLDDPYGKFSLALSVPLMRWAPGLSIGALYSHSFTGSNSALAGGVDHFDLALSWRANRFVSLAFVARHFHAPLLATGERELPVLDPEIALRPFGDRRLELAYGMRISVANRQAEAQIRPYFLGPRGRVLFGARGVRAYAEAELLTYFERGVSERRDGVRIGLGVQFDTPHLGIAAGPSFGAGHGGTFDGLQGGAGRLRISKERYTEVLPLRPRRVTRLSLAGKSGDRALAELVWTLDELARWRGGVLLIEVAGTGFGTAQLEELREAVIRYQAAGGKVVAYLEGGRLRHYFLASVADRIIAHPSSRLGITGLSTRTLYWRDLLAKLGISAEILRIAEYKGRPETFMEMGPSQPVAEANRVLLTDVWNHLVRLIARARGHDPSVVSRWVDEAPWDPAEARAQGIIDELAWPDQLDASLESWLGRSIRIEAPPHAPLRAGDWEQPAHVAVLHVSGGIVRGNSARIPLLGMDLAGAATLSAEIEMLREDPDVKAVVVRIDSVGGSVAASRDIARELTLTRAVKPVVISMGEVAASGGYYVATGGDYIFADATTRTGSIGVYLFKLDLSEFLTKLGVHAELLSLGARAAMNSDFKPYSDDERAAAMAGIESSYATFLGEVAGARAMTLEQADALARGRVWSGVRAMEVGLVDRYGGMYEAVDRAARMARMTPPSGRGPAVLHYPAPPTLLDQIRGLFGLSVNIPLSRSGAVADPLAPLATVGRAASFAMPLLQVLGLLPAALWLGEAEALAVAPGALDIEG